MSWPDILTNIGTAIAALFAGYLAYFKTRPPLPPTKTDTIVAGVGMEFGNRLQADQAIAELKRIGDCLTILADRRQATTEAKLDRILQELEEKEEHELAERARRITRSRRPARTRKTSD